MFEKLPATQLNKLPILSSLTRALKGLMEWRLVKCHTPPPCGIHVFRYPSHLLRYLSSERLPGYSNQMVESRSLRLRVINFSGFNSPIHANRYMEQSVLSQVAHVESRSYI